MIRHVLLVVDTKTKISSTSPIKFDSNYLDLKYIIIKFELYSNWFKIIKTEFDITQPKINLSLKWSKTKSTKSKIYRDGILGKIIFQICCLWLNLKLGHFLCHWKLGQIEKRSLMKTLILQLRQFHYETDLNWIK